MLNQHESHSTSVKLLLIFNSTDAKRVRLEGRKTKECRLIIENLDSDDDGKWEFIILLGPDGRSGRLHHTAVVAVDEGNSLIYYNHFTTF